MMMAAGFAYMEVPEALLPAFQRGRGPVAPETPPQLVDNQQAAPLPVPFAQDGGPARRWSVDGWLLLRDDTTTPVTSGRPSYGRSQVGAIARFELAPSSSHRPQAYLRGSAALEGQRDVEGAIGLSARPISQVPVRVAAEMRVADRPGGSEVRPAAFAVTELPPVALPGGASAELYVQGGYVSGDYATAFVDGQARVDRSLARSDDFDLRAGAGAWGGAQEGAARLDVGPSASIRFRLGEGSGRLAADYRFRVAGDAQPSSGPALTLSAGF